MSNESPWDDCKRAIVLNLRLFAVVLVVLIGLKWYLARHMEQQPDDAQDSTYVSH